jgi:cob(I)alamin adenosyltransferase
MDHRVKPGGDEEEAELNNPETVSRRSPRRKRAADIENESAKRAGEQA